MTGGAATTETPEEGLVIGDRVNTAARIQSAAPPGCCYVDETTRAATAAAIAYSDAGEHALKGKSEPVRLFQATRVVAATAGSQRSGVLEAPFTGRDHELRLVKELFHASAERRSARLVLVSGVAGVGKSRLAWEFFKYIDGLAGEVLWHAGRCLSYGEGVSYWALSEMVRARLQIGEEDPLEVVAERLTLRPRALDPRRVRPRVHLPPPRPAARGSRPRRSLAREELFSGWRLFFERLAEHLPVVMVVEDLQWADAGMVDFLDHLLDWSADHALFLLVLTRPEAADQRGLVLSRRNLTTLSLDPLSDEVIGELLDGLVADLPAPRPGHASSGGPKGFPSTPSRPCGACSTGGSWKRATTACSTSSVSSASSRSRRGSRPSSPPAWTRSTPEERRVVKECAVLGESFPRQAIEAVSDTDPGELDEILPSLVRKEVLTVRADKLSPERGQYAFTQSLIRSVAYDMLTRAERKARHLDDRRPPAPGPSPTTVPRSSRSSPPTCTTPTRPPARTTTPRSSARRPRTPTSSAGDRAESVGAPEAAETAYLTAAELSSRRTRSGRGSPRRAPRWPC